MKSAEDWVHALELIQHPEGGWYKEVYRSSHSLPQTALPSGFDGQRPVATSIYYLLEADHCSMFHRIRSDETWHHYDGVPLRIHMLDRTHSSVLLAKDPPNAFPQATVPANTWFAAEPEATSGYTLVGCSVAPGFNFSDFELAEKHALTQSYPDHHTLIARLTP